MSIYIKGMEMPESCNKCQFRHMSLTQHDYCTAARKSLCGINTKKERLSDCPIIEVPTHGTLVDADKFDRIDINGQIFLACEIRKAGKSIVISAEREEAQDESNPG